MAPGAAGLHLDAVGADPVDHLGIEPEVEALCWVIAARDTVPPLSVGLFGDWGSGKTTFMALMQARIRDLAEQSQKRPESPWCGNVMQISFNAWTYADDNLWASLVTDIFTALAAPARYEPEDAEGDPVGMLATIAQRRHAAGDAPRGGGGTHRGGPAAARGAAPTARPSRPRGARRRPRARGWSVGQG